MPPASNSVSASSKSKANRFSTSPDSEPGLPAPETQPVSSKKKKKNAANKHVQNNNNNDRASISEVAREDSPPATRPQTILSQLGHGFALPVRKDSPIHDVEDEDVTTTEKVSDQYTPPNDNWLEDNIYDNKPHIERLPKVDERNTSQIGPGFSTNTRYDSRSPPVSPPSRHARPVSYGGVGIPPMPSLQRASPSAYSYVPSAYGSPPAPHLPQPHFYQAQDVNIGYPPTSIPGFREEPSLIRHLRLLSVDRGSNHGVIFGFEGRMNIMHLEGGVAHEIGILEGFAGTVVDAVLLEQRNGPYPFADITPLVAVVVHGPKESHSETGTENTKDELRSNIRQQATQYTGEYTTRVEVYSLSTQERVAVLLETPAQTSQSVFRGAPPTPPGPIGQLRLQASGAFLTITSGVSGELFAYTIARDTTPIFECIGKFWTAIQPQTQRRESSHHQSSDPDLSPADLGRAVRSRERAISSINGRWLAISPASSPSRPSLGAVLGENVKCKRPTTVMTTSAPARPSITCEVESPDVDTILGKVARGVAQELVKGAKWLGDQGYQTWQSYWRKDQSPSASSPSPAYSPPVHPAVYAPNSFPPTHGEAQQSLKEPELVSIYDLQGLYDTLSRKGVDELKPLATFQPPRGCSFLSLAPHGLNLLTAGRKGDVQYIWDLMQIKHSRTHVYSTEDERTRSQARVRQIAKYERLSGSTIVDVIWDSPAGSRFAVLTKNKTIHLFDLPASSFRWPPPRIANKSRPTSRSMDMTQNDASISGGILASAMNIANQAQPMIANWRGRAPSMGGGLAGIGQTGIGLASATGARGSKVVAAGLSKSLGAASETVHQMRHAGESRLHLKSSREPLPGRVFWYSQGRKHILAILESDSIKQYQVRCNKKQERREQDNVTVFAARKASLVKLPVPSQLTEEPATVLDEGFQRRVLHGFWKSKPTTVPEQKPVAHPLSFAEIETNAPYQPFHSDRRVTLSVSSGTGQSLEDQLPTVSLMLNPQQRTRPGTGIKPKEKWVFGDEIATTTLNISKIQIPDDDEQTGSVIYRETVQVTSPRPGDEGMDQIVSTTRRRKIKKGHSVSHGTGSDIEKEDGFFEDDCDVLDFATDRV